MTDETAEDLIEELEAVKEDLKELHRIVKTLQDPHSETDAQFIARNIRELKDRVGI